METTIKSYHFNTSHPEEAAAYKALAASLGKTNGKCFISWGMGSHYEPDWAEGVPVTLETKHLFENQWNTAPGGVAGGRRVFDWAEDYMPDKKIKRGHYLTITREMTAARKHTVACGYCGHQEPDAAAASFCSECFGSEYLTEKDLHLTRLVPVSDKSDRAPLTEEEASVLVARWREAQGLGKQSREAAQLSKRRLAIAALVPDAESEAAASIQRAHTETNALTWLMDHGFLGIENVIYYKHTGRFNFGWRNALSPAQCSDLRDILDAQGDAFPYLYDIKEA
jgi:hypothetical protein